MHFIKVASNQSQLKKECDSRQGQEEQQGLSRRVAGCSALHLAEGPARWTSSLWLNSTRALSGDLEPMAKKALATHSSTLAWKLPWTEEPGRLQSMGSLGVGHD